MLKSYSSWLREPYRDRTEDEFPFDASVGGFGGEEYWNDFGEAENPVIYSHGLGRTGADGREICLELLGNGYSGGELYAVTYGNFLPGLEEGAEQLDELVGEVLEHTGAEEVDIVGHSMGGTIPLYMMKEHGDGDIGTVISLGGPEKGSYWNEYLETWGIPAKDEISIESARNGKLAGLDEHEFDATTVTVQGTEDSAYPVRDPEERHIGQYQITLETTHEGLKHPKIVGELGRQFLRN